MPALSTTRLRGLLFSLAFSACSASALAASPSGSTEIQAISPQTKQQTAQDKAAQQQAAQINASSASRYLQAGSAWICTAEGDSWDCQQGAEQLKPYHSDRTGVELDRADDRFRQTYPDTYASLTQVLTAQQQARELWLKSNRQASNPDGVAEAESLFANAPFAFLDWYPNPDGISPISHCEGSYIQPEFSVDTGLDSDQLPFSIQADFSRTIDDSITELYGDIYLRKGNSLAASQRAQVNHLTQQAELNGLIQIREPGLLLLGERAEVDTATNEATVDKAQFVFHSRHLRGSAEQIVRRGDDLFIYQGAYTRCQPSNNSWSIEGSKIVLHKETGLGEVTNATLRVADIPVFYVPYMTFPITSQRMSGLLFPNLGFTSDGGIDYTQPYYFNIAPNYDDTLTLRHVGKRGDMLENEFRYLDTFGNFVLGFGYLPNDVEKNGQERWLLGFDHSGSPAPNWTSRIDYTAVSDSDYFNDLGTDLDLSEQSHLDKIAEAHYRDRNLVFDIQMHDYQTIDDAAEKPYRKLPSIRLSGTPDFEINWLNLELLSNLTLFDRDPTDFSGIDRTSGTRLHLESNLDLRYDRPWGYVRPSVKLLHTEYQLNNQPTATGEAPSRTLPLLSFDSALYFDRDFSYNDQSYIHTLEPRLFLLDIPYSDQSELPNFDSSELTFNFSQLFRDNRFSGYDRIGDTRQATLGLTSRLLDDQGSERGNISLGQIHYFKDRQVRLKKGNPVLTEKRSNLVGEALWNVTDRFRVTADAEWNDKANENLSRNLKLSYRRDIDHQINLSYRFSDNEVEQTDLTAIWPLSPQWSMLGRWQRDLINNEHLDLIAGIEYENCCWLIRTSYRQWVTDDLGDERVKEGIYLQFVLKGLGGLDSQATGDDGSDAKHFLKDITGYEERKDYE